MSKSMQQFIKIQVFLLLTLLVYVPLKAGNQEFEYAYGGDTIRYSVTDDEARICMAIKLVSKSSSLRDIAIPAVAKHGDIEYSVSSIDGKAFYMCSGIESVTIPNSVTYIGQFAFCDCKDLQSVNLGESVTILDIGAFKDSPLKSLYIPNSVSIIEGLAFSGCGFDSVAIGNSVTFIGADAFYNCQNLKTVYISDSVNTIESFAFSSNPNLESVHIGDSVCLMGLGVFKDCPNLKSAYIGNSLTEISNSAFFNCTSLSAITLPESITIIGDSAFDGCRSLKTLTLGGSLIDINEYAFRNCDKLKSLSLGNSVKYIGDHAFDGCSSLEYAEFGNSIIDIGDYAFNNCIQLSSIVIPNSVSRIGQYAFYNCENLKAATVGNTVAGISTGSFAGCISLESVTLGKSIGMIGTSAFMNCRLLKSITIPNSVITVSENAFKGCKSLDSISIGNSTSSIFEHAFEDCSSLEYVTIPESVTYIGEDAFKGTGLKEVNTQSIKAWVNIDFSCPSANPTYFAGKLLLDGKQISHLVIPEGINRISQYSFINCRDLTVVTLQGRIKSVGKMAFYSCEGLQRFCFTNARDFLGIEYATLDARLTHGNNAKIYVGGQPYEPEDIIWPTDLIRIPPFVFYQCQTLKSVVVPDKLESIGEMAFAESSLNYIGTPGNTGRSQNISNLPPTMSKVNPSTFAETNLTGMSIPNTVTTIGDKSFSGCRDMKDLTLGNSISTIGEEAFASCESIISLTVPASVDSIGTKSFNRCLNLSTVRFDGNPRAIGKGAFTSEIEGVGIVSAMYINNPDSWCRVKNYDAIMKDTGSLCIADTKVSNLVLKPAEGVVNTWSFSNVPVERLRVTADEIKEHAFQGSSLTAICIDVKRVGKWAFGSCDNLRSVYSLTEEPPIAYFYSFGKYEDVTLFVPIGASEKYRNNSGAWRFFTNIVESDFSDIDDMFKANYTVSGINSVVSDPDLPFDPAIPYDVYNLNGLRIAQDRINHLAPGIYIIRQDRIVKKIVVK